MDKEGEILGRKTGGLLAGAIQVARLYGSNGKFQLNLEPRSYTLQSGFQHRKKFVRLLVLLIAKILFVSVRNDIRKYKKVAVLKILRSIKIYRVLLNYHQKH